MISFCIHSSFLFFWLLSGLVIICVSLFSGIVLLRVWRQMFIFDVVLLMPWVGRHLLAQNFILEHVTMINMRYNRLLCDRLLIELHLRRQLRKTLRRSLRRVLRRHLGNTLILVLLLCGDLLNCLRNSLRRYLTGKPSQCLGHYYITLQAFGRHFYPKRLTVD